MKAGRKRSSAPAPSTAKRNWQLPPQVVRYGSLMLRVAATIICFLNLCPLSVRQIGTNLDPSWVFGLNYAHVKGLVWGRDVAFTYGPWGFLAVPVRLGANIDVAIVCQTLAWLAALPPLWYLVRRRATLPGVLLFAWSSGFAHATIANFTCDEYLGFLCLLYLAAAYLSTRWMVPLVVAAFIAAAATMIKFSTGVFCAVAVLSFPATFLLRRMRQVWQSLAIGIAALTIGFVGLYLSHHLSLATMFSFLRLSVDISDAYTVAQALPTVPELLTAALCLTIVYVVLSVVLFVRRDRAARFGLVLLLPLFIAFKHGFVRSDTHVGFYFSIGGFLIGLLCLLAEFRPVRPWIIFGALAVGTSVLLLQAPLSKILVWHDPILAGVNTFPAELKVLNVPELKRTLATQEAALLAPDRLSPDLLQKVGKSSIAVFPYELAYAPANDLTLVLMPLLQTYIAASASLDEWNARLFADDNQRPDFLLMEWKSIDYRHPLFDVPATFLAIYKWYDFDSDYGQQILLRKRLQPRFRDLKQLVAPHQVNADSVEVPQSLHPVVGSIQLSLTLAGRLSKLFWKVPEVDLRRIGAHGAYGDSRAAPAALASPGPLNFMPFNLESIRNLTERNQVDTRVTHIGLFGPGVSLYQPQVTVQFREIPGIELTEAAQAYDAFRGVAERGSFNTWRIEKVSGIDAASVKEVIVPASQPWTQVSGWAIDPASGNCATAVTIRVDGTRNTQTAYGTFNSAIPILFPGDKCRTAGFEWAVPLSKGTHTLQVRILSTARDAWYTADSTLTVNVPENQ